MDKHYWRDWLNVEIQRQANNKRRYWQIRNFLSRCRYWWQGYTWGEAKLRVLMDRIQLVLARCGYPAVWRHNRVQ